MSNVIICDRCHKILTCSESKFCLRYSYVPTSGEVTAIRREYCKKCGDQLLEMIDKLDKEGGIYVQS